MKLKKPKIKIIKTYHSFHIVDPSPWPFFAAYSAYVVALGMVSYMHRIKGGFSLVLCGSFLFSLVTYSWFRDIVREATFEDVHTARVWWGLRLAFVLFLISESMFFFSFFWAFFYACVSPTVAIGCVWPPKAITPISPFGIPLLNTFILITSGVSITWTHKAVVARAKKHAILGMLVTLALAILFITFQCYEYLNAPFNISDGIFGSCFYITTGFHGLHVIIGTIALFVTFIRLVLNHFTNTQHLGLQFTVWYWHFVDVIWLLLFVIVYWWGSM